MGVSLTVTPCWCYGSETMDMDPHLPKAVWGFNGTERPGAVYLAAVLAAHNQKGLPAFSIYGHDVQDPDDESIPADVQEKLLRFARAGLAVATMRGKSYLAMGGVSMGIAGSIVNHDLLRAASWACASSRSTWSSSSAAWSEGIYDPEEYERAYAWVQAELPRGQGLQRARRRSTAATQKDEDWD